MTNLKAAVYDALEHAHLAIRMTDDLWKVVTDSLEDEEVELLEQRIYALQVIASFVRPKPPIPTTSTNELDPRNTIPITSSHELPAADDTLELPTADGQQ